MKFDNWHLFSGSRNGHFDSLVFHFSVILNKDKKTTAIADTEQNHHQQNTNASITFKVFQPG